MESKSSGGKVDGAIVSTENVGGKSRVRGIFERLYIGRVIDASRLGKG